MSTERQFPWGSLGIVVVCLAVAFACGCVHTEIDSPRGWRFRTTRVIWDTKIGTVRIPTTQGAPVEIGDYDSKARVAEAIRAAVEAAR